MAGLYSIIYKISNSYKVKLPKSIKIYNIFFPDCLQKATNNPLSGQKNELLLLIEIIFDKEYKV